MVSVFTGSRPLRVCTNTSPQAGQLFRTGTAMKMNLIRFRAFTLVSTIIALACLRHPASAASFDWLGGDLLWPTPANWSPLGPPGPNDDARFFDPGGAPDANTVNNVVSVDTTVRSLWFGHTNGFHNMLIEPGVTLTLRGTNDNGFGRLGSDPNATAPNPNVQSTLYVGTKSEVAAGTIITATIRGEGTLSLDNTNNEVNIRQVFGASGGAHRSILDMSGLADFNANLSRIRIGDGEAGVIRRAEGQFILAKTNRITLSGPSIAEDVQLLVGNNDVNNNGNGSISHLVLGQENILNVDHVLVGARKQQGNMRFLETLVSPSLRMRGSDGTSRVTALRIGDESDQANSGNPTTGRIDLGLGTVDILADTIIVGKGQQQTGREAIGFLTLGAGTLDVNTLEVAFQTSETANNRVDGTVTFNGTTVMVNDMLRLGRSAGAPFPRNAILNINGGLVNAANRLVTEGTATINMTNALLALSGGSTVNASTMVIDGSTISNASLIRVTNSLTMANFGRILGDPIYDLGNSGSASWDVQAIDGNALTVNRALQGSGMVVGDVVQANGATISPGGNETLGRISVQAGGLNGGNVVLEGGTLRFDLSSDAVLGTNDQMAVGQLLELTGTNDVNLTALGGGFDTFNHYTLITSGALLGSPDHFRVAGALAQSRYTFTFDTTFVPNSVVLFVSGEGPAGLTWVGDGSANRWELQGAANWTRGGPSAEQFYSLDAVTFNDFGSASPAVTLVGMLSPGAVTVSNPTRNYTFSGNGGIQGAPLTKEGTGSLTFNNTGNNGFGGPVTLWDGAVTFLNTGLNTFANGLEVNGGSLTLSGNNTNNVTAGALSVAAFASLTAANAHGNDFGAGLMNLDGTLTINQAADSTLNRTLSGGGTLIKAGTGTLTLANDNSALSTVIQINGGTVRAGAPNSLGVTGAAIANGGALNINGQNLTALPVTVSGAGPAGDGAVVSTAAPQLNALANVTLQGNATFGGSGPWNTDPVLNRGRWDLRNGSLSTAGQSFNLTKRGSNQVTLAGVNVDEALANIDVQQGLLGFEGTTTSMGEPTNTLTVRAGATVSFFDTTTAWNKKIVLFGNGVTPNLLNYNGANTIAGPVTLNGPCVIGGVPADRGAPVSLTLAGPIDGSGGFRKVGADRLVLGGLYTYSGDTTVNVGTLALADEGSLPNSPHISISAGATFDVTGAFGNALTVVSGQGLQGNGTIAGGLITAAGSTVSPGFSLDFPSFLIGDLTVSGNVELNGVLHMDLNAVLDTNDVLRAGSIAFGGTLALENLIGTLSVGDSFKLFDAPFYTGSFASVVPATPGPGLAWDLSTLDLDGTLRIQTGQPRPQIATTSLSGGALVFGGSGGTPNGTYYVVSSTNLAISPAGWTRILTNTFDANGNFSVNHVINPATPRRFFILETP
jgi:autotransporter-associated beta strand protein